MSQRGGLDQTHNFLSEETVRRNFLPNSFLLSEFFPLRLSTIVGSEEWKRAKGSSSKHQNIKTSLMTLQMAGMVNKTHMRGRHKPGSKMRSIHRGGWLFSPRVWLISFQIWLSHISWLHTFWQEAECFDKWSARFWSADPWTQVGAAAVGDRSVQVSVSGSSLLVSSLRADTDPYLQHNKRSCAEDKPNAVIIPVHLSVPSHLNQALSALKLEGHSWLLKMYRPAPKKGGQTNCLPIKNLHLKYKVSMYLILTVYMFLTNVVKQGFKPKEISGHISGSSTSKSSGLKHFQPVLVLKGQSVSF